MRTVRAKLCEKPNMEIKSTSIGNDNDVPTTRYSLHLSDTNGEDVNAWLDTQGDLGQHFHAVLHADDMKHSQQKGAIFVGFGTMVLPDQEKAVPYVGESEAEKPFQNSSKVIPVARVRQPISRVTVIPMSSQRTAPVTVRKPQGSKTLRAVPAAGKEDAQKHSQTKNSPFTHKFCFAVGGPIRERLAALKEYLLYRLELTDDIDDAYTYDYNLFSPK